MATPTTPAAPTTLRLLDALRSHLLTTGLPEPAAVDFLPSSGPRISVQPGNSFGHTPGDVLGLLLLWTHGLHGITGTWFLTTNHSDGVHIHIGLDGRLANGTTLHIYTSIPHAPAADLVHLEPGEHDSVSPDELAWLRTELLTRAADPAASAPAA